MTETQADLAALMEAAADRWPDATAWVFDERGERLSFSDVRHRAGVLARFLSEHGVEEGDRVAVMLDNRPEFPLTWLAVASIGAVLVPLNINYLDDDAGHVLHQSGAAVVVTCRRFVPLMRRLASSSSVRAVFSVDGGDQVGTLPAPDESYLPAPVTPRAARANLPVNIQYTSGTTGKPKGCVLSHRYWTTLAHGLVAEHPHLREDDVILTAQPFHYIDPQWNIAAALASGATLVVLDGFHPSTFWEKVRQHSVSWFYCLGLMPTLLLQMPPSYADKNHRVRAVHCSAIPLALHRELEERWGVPWFEAFGMTETGADIRVSPSDHDEVLGTGCLGRPLPHREVQISTPQGEPVADGETGELWLRGLGLMLRYHDDPDATQRAFDSGWFRTGDLVRADTEGRIYYVGRLKDSIRRSGENISAAEIEEVLTQHEAVALAAVVPAPDELREEEVHAFVVPSTGRRPGQALADELDRFCRSRLAYFKAPRYWTFREKLPMTASERVEKASLKAEGVSADTLETGHRARHTGVTASGRGQAHN